MVHFEQARDAPAARRNAGPILSVLRAHLPAKGRVLEVASGTGQHAVAFAEAFPDLDWTPSDPSADARVSIEAWRGEAGLPNLNLPLTLDAADPGAWPTGPFDAVVCINMVHISPWSATEGLTAGAAAVLETGGLLALYGPYWETNVEPAPSNLDFDADLKRRNPDWGLRNRDDVVAEARKNGLFLTRRVAMPANNLTLLFRRA